MKKVSLMLVAVLLFSTGSLFANHSKEGEGFKEIPNLSQQIGQLLKKNKFTSKECGYQAQVLFMLNKDKEIVVLTVDADKDHIESFIKNRLNYKKVITSNYDEDKKYTISVRIKS